MNIFKDVYAVVLGKGLIDESEYKITTDDYVAFEYFSDYFMSKERAENLALEVGGKVVKLEIVELEKNE